MYNKKHCKLFAKQRLILQMEELMKIVYRWGTKCRFFSRTRLLSSLPRQTNLIDHLIALGCLRTHWKVYGPFSTENLCIVNT